MDEKFWHIFTSEVPNVLTQLSVVEAYERAVSSSLQYASRCQGHILSVTSTVHTGRTDTAPN